MKPLSECRLYTFIDTAYLAGRPPELVARQLCEGGSDLIQLRAKNSSVDEIRRMAGAILPITSPFGVPLVINDQFVIAAELDADFCHFGQEDFFGAGHVHVTELTKQTGRPGIGLSTHAPPEAERAVAAGADYIAIGPVYPTDTKPSARPVTLDYVRWAAANVELPWFAIGGINLRNLDEVLGAGARRIGVVSAILNASNIVESCQKFKERLVSVPV